MRVWLSGSFSTALSSLLYVRVDARSTRTRTRTRARDSQTLAFLLVYADDVHTNVNACDENEASHEASVLASWRDDKPPRKSDALRNPPIPQGGDVRFISLLDTHVPSEVPVTLPPTPVLAAAPNGFSYVGGGRCLDSNRQQLTKYVCDDVSSTKVCSELCSLARCSGFTLMPRDGTCLLFPTGLIDEVMPQVCALADGIVCISIRNSAANPTPACSLAYMQRWLGYGL